MKEEEQLLLQQHFFHQQMMQQHHNGTDLSPIPPPWSLPPVHAFNPAHFPTNPAHDHDPYRSSRPVPHQFGYDIIGPSSANQLGLISETVLGRVVQPGSSAHFGIQSELMARMSAQEMMDAKALAASKSHSEAERRRRERINNHLAKLRSLLPNTTKTDKASLLAEVIQHVKELKRQTSIIAESSPVPTEIDELTVDDETYDHHHEDGKYVIKASLCCEDRSDLLPDLIKTLKALRLRTLKAEITTLGGRVKNVLFITREEDEESNSGDQEQEKISLGLIQDALKAVMERANGDHESSSSSVSVKRQRTNMNIYP